MCLFINSAPKVADEDIFCYKILLECELEGYPYMSLFQENPIKPEIVDGLCSYVGEGDRTIKEDICGYLFVSKGYIHTYKALLVAEEICYHWKNLFNNNTHLFECKIPKGIEYYEGYDDKLLQGYASERIVFVKKLF